jgi:Effector-associated domain 9
MPPNVQETERKILEKRLAKWIAEYEAINDDIDDTIDPDTRTKLERKAEQKKKDIKALNREIEALGVAPLSSQARERLWKAKLPEIDFKDAIARFNSVHDCLKDNGGAALFLIQDGVSLAAPLCIERMLERFKESGGDNLRELPVGFPAGRPSSEGVLSALAGHLGLGHDADTQQVVTQLLGTTRYGGRVWIRVKVPGDLADAPEFLAWLRETFWRPLVEAHERRGDDDRYAIVVLVLVVNAKIARDRLYAEMTCPEGNFLADRFVELVLEERWKLEYIRKWLRLFSGLCATWPDPKVQQLASQLFLAGGNGLPQLVVDAIKDHFDSLS